MRRQATRRVLPLLKAICTVYLFLETADNYNQHTHHSCITDRPKQPKPMIDVSKNPLATGTTSRRKWIETVRADAMKNIEKEKSSVDRQKSNVDRQKTNSSLRKTKKK